ncbi:MAG: hypothetical protein WDN04_23725 [Rhodospirillales bacterium]
MCGLAGILYADPEQNPDLSLARAMTDAIAHRGPDGEGFHAEPGIVLGHRRLAVIDPAGGQQPMYNEDNSVAIIFNGEIYNHEALRAELRQRGHSFRNHCDTEAIVHAWESWGPDCVTRLSGMFAFALWDRARRTLFCARDRLGKKPFYYATTGGDFVFASELAALFALPNLPRRMRPEAVEDFFAFGYVPEPGTIFSGIEKLPASHTLLIENGRAPVLRRYWSPPTHITPCTEADALIAMRAPPRRCGRHPPGRGCAARRVPVRWGRFQCRGRDSRRPARHAARHFHDRLRRRRGRNPVRPHGRRPLRYAPA